MKGSGQREIFFFAAVY